MHTAGAASDLLISLATLGLTRLATVWAVPLHSTLPFLSSQRTAELADLLPLGSPYTGRAMLTIEIKSCITMCSCLT